MLTDTSKFSELCKISVAHTRKHPSTFIPYPLSSMALQLAVILLAFHVSLLVGNFQSFMNSIFKLDFSLYRFLRDLWYSVGSTHFMPILLHLHLCTRSALIGGRFSMHWNWGRWSTAAHGPDMSLTSFRSCRLSCEAPIIIIRQKGGRLQAVNTNCFIDKHTSYCLYVGFSFQAIRMHSRPVLNYADFFKFKQ